MDAASQALRVAVHFGLCEGSLARAAAAVCELKKMGQNVEQEISQIADTFAVDSPFLLEHGAAPPALVRSRLSINPIPLNSSEAELIEHVKSAVAEASALLEQSETSEPLKVQRQALFSTLDAAGLRVLLGMLELRIVRAGEPIVVQNEPGDEAYVIARGEVEVSKKTDKVHQSRWPA